MKQIATFYIKQVLLLGTAGFLIFQIMAWFQVGWFWASDAFQAWLLSLIIVSIFLAFVCFPILWLSSKFGIGKWSIILSAVSGPVVVIICVVIISNRQPSLYNYFIWPANMHLIFSIVGLLFGLSYFKGKNA